MRKLKKTTAPQVQKTTKGNNKKLLIPLPKAGLMAKKKSSPCDVILPGIHWL